MHLRDKSKPLRCVYLLYNETMAHIASTLIILFEHTISCHILPLAMAFSFISLTTKEEEEEEEGIIIITRQSSSHYVVVKNSCEIKQRR